MSRRAALVLGGVAVLSILVAAIGIRAATGTIADDVGELRISAECTGWTGASDCHAWAAEVLAAGAPSATFEMEDVIRLRLDRPLLGLASTCIAEYFLSRYPEEVAWAEEVPCPGS
jgi:hypothetical protein